MLTRSFAQQKQEQQEDGDTDMAERPTVREVRSEAEAKLRSFEVEAGEGGKTGASLETGTMPRPSCCAFYA